MSSMQVPHPIPYQGSKRQLAAAILGYTPAKIGRLIEPFAGSAAVSLSARNFGRASRIYLNDLNSALVAVWREIIDDPEGLGQRYEDLWNAQHEDPQSYYNQIRREFNKQHDAAQFLFLLARCVKASVRYNANGEFNQGPDNRRLGTRPATMRDHVHRASALLKGRTELSSVDYREVLEYCREGDLVYMDPPYQGVCATRDARYISGVDHGEFVVALENLNRRGVPFVVSYDGSLGGRNYGKPMPESLGLTYIEIHVGRSSQATLLGRGDDTCESLYLSPSLREMAQEFIPQRISLRSRQPELFLAS
jgi:DNA adenine methylase